MADDGLQGHGHVFYTVFTQDDHGTWQRQAEARLKVHDAFGWLHPHAQDVYLAQRALATHPPVYVATPASSGPVAASLCLHLGDSGVSGLP